MNPARAFWLKSRDAATTGAFDSVSTVELGRLSSPSLLRKASSTTPLVRPVNVVMDVSSNVRSISTSVRFTSPGAVIIVAVPSTVIGPPQRYVTEPLPPLMSTFMFPGFVAMVILPENIFSPGAQGRCTATPPVSSKLSPRYASSPAITIWSIEGLPLATENAIE